MTSSGSVLQSRSAYVAARAGTDAGAVLPRSFLGASTMGPKPINHVHGPALVTRYHGPTDHRGARVSCRPCWRAADDSRADVVTVGWPYELDGTRAHAVAVAAWIERHKADDGYWAGLSWLSSESPDGRGYVFVGHTEGGT